MALLPVLTTIIHKQYVQQRETSIHFALAVKDDSEYGTQ